MDLRFSLLPVIESPLATVYENEVGVVSTGLEVAADLGSHLDFPSFIAVLSRPLW